MNEHFSDENVVQINSNMHTKEVLIRVVIAFFVTWINWTKREFFSVELKMDGDENFDPDRYLKNLQRVFGISKRLRDLATSRLVEVTSEQLIRQAASRAHVQTQRQDRINSIDSHHRYVIDIVAEQLNISSEEVIEGIADSNKHVQLLHSITEQNGLRAIIFFYDNYPYPSRGKETYDSLSTCLHDFSFP